MVFGGWDSYGNPYGVSNPNYKPKTVNTEQATVEELTQYRLAKIEEIAAEDRKIAEMKRAVSEMKRAGFAEKNQLICKAPLTQKYMDEFDDYSTEMCNEGDLSYCNIAKEDRKKMKICKESGFEYRHIKVFTFPVIESSKNSTSIYTEGHNESCWGGTSVFEGYGSVIKPPYISFKLTSFDSFNINSETLIGGFGSKRNWKCNFKN